MKTSSSKVLSQQQQRRNKSPGCLSRLFAWRCAILGLLCLGWMYGFLIRLIWQNSQNELIESAWNHAGMTTTTTKLKTSTTTLINTIQHQEEEKESHLQLQQSSKDTKNTTSTKIRIIYTVFAGRKDRLLLQEVYWKQMMEMGAIDEVHLWDYCVYEADRLHLFELKKKYSFIQLKFPKDVPMNEFYWFDKNHSLKGWDLYRVPGYPKEEGRAVFRWPPVRGYTEYFQYYAKEYVHDRKGTEHDIILKADDDIVWLNATEIRPFAEYFWNHPEIWLLSAAVVNQGLVVHYQQQQCGAVPKELFGELPLPDNGMGTWHDNATQALQIHQYFLSSQEARDKFYCQEGPVFHPFSFTINVNFVALRRKDFPEYMQLTQEKLIAEKRYYDEGTMTWDAIKKRSKVEGIYMKLVVSHGTFGAQDAVTQAVLEEYVKYGKRERSDLYGTLLDDYNYSAFERKKRKLE